MNLLKIVLLLGLLSLSACANEPTPTPASTPRPTETPGPTNTPLPTNTPEPIFEPLNQFGEIDIPIEIAKNVSYTAPARSGIATQILDVYRPVAATNTPLPTVILLHGAGSGKEDIRDWAQATSEQNLLVYAANWPVPPLTSFNSNSEKRLREANDAIGCLIHFVVATAEMHGGSTETLVLAGFSAGALQGSITALSGPEWQNNWDSWATANDGPEQQQKCLYENESGKWVTGFVGVGGPYDLFATVLGNPAGLNERSRGLYNLISSSALLDNGPHPLEIHVVHGSGDSVVRESFSSGFATAVERAGLPVTYTLVDGAGHTTINATTVPLILDLAGQ